MHERGRLLGGCPWNIFIWMIWKIDITEGLNASLIYQSFKTQLQHLICPFWEISLKPVSFWYHITILMVKNWSRFMKNCKIWPLQSSYRISLDISKWESHFLLTLFLKKKRESLMRYSLVCRHYWSQLWWEVQVCFSTGSLPYTQVFVTENFIQNW